MESNQAEGDLQKIGTEYHQTSTYDKVLGYVTVVAITIYLTWRLFFTLPFSYGYLSVVVGLLLFICEFISGAQAIINYLSQIRPLPLERPVIPEDWYPHIDILVATHDEEVNLMYNTLNACRYLEYPDKSKVHVHLCDDGNRPEMKELARKLGINYIGMAEPKHAKAGNMNNALAQTNSPIIAFLDADMIPRREFLVNVVPFFFLPRMKKNEKGKWVERTPEEIDPEYKIGFVQTPQNFYNPDLFQYNLYAENRIPNEQIYFFREVNVSRNRYNATHMCGSNMLISRKALAEAGNFATNNITEDHETGLKIQTAGYTCYSIPECLANGLNPPAVVNLIVQRERWGRGCMQTFYNVRPFFDKRIPIMRRLNYLCTLFYWLTFFCRFIYVMAPILVALFNVFIVECSLLELLLIWFPYYALHTMAMAKISEKTRTVHWSNTVDTIMFPFLFAPIMLDMVGVRLKRFKVTDKSHQRFTNTRPSLIMPHLLMLILSVAGIVVCVVEIIHYRAFYNVIILFWLVVNSKSLLLSIFFMLGRVNERYSYRFDVTVPMELEANGIVYKGATLDVSEGGFSAALNFPAYVDPDAVVTARLYDRIYRAEMRCSLTQVRRTKEHDWLYSMRIVDMDEESLSQYRQIIYERDPTLPETVQETIPLVEDLKVNFDKRLGKHLTLYSRKLPRVFQSFSGVLADGRSVALNDFSYRYVQVYPLPPLAPGKTETITLASGVEMIVTAPEEHLAAQNRNLFAVVNWRDWTEKDDYLRLLAVWAEKKEDTIEAPTRKGGTIVRLRSLTKIIMKKITAKTGKIDKDAEKDAAGEKVDTVIVERVHTDKSGNTSVVDKFEIYGKTSKTSVIEKRGPIRNAPSTRVVDESGRIGGAASDYKADGGDGAAKP